MSNSVEQQLMSASEIASAISQMACELADKVSGVDNVAIIGVRRRGDELARRLLPLLSTALASDIESGSIDITLYRDDFDSLTEQPVLGDTDISFDLEGRTIILVDDVLYTGRTVRAALDELLDFGRPSRILLAALVDRGWRELPIAADIVGQQIDTRREDNLQVYLSETDGRDEVVRFRTTGASDE